MATKAKLRAVRKWKHRHPQKQKYYFYHYAARTFVKRYATASDLHELQQLIKQRLA